MISEKSQVTMSIMSLSTHIIKIIAHNSFLGQWSHNQNKVRIYKTQTNMRKWEREWEEEREKEGVEGIDKKTHKVEVGCNFEDRLHVA